MRELDNVALTAAMACFKRACVLPVVPWERNRKSAHIAGLSFEASSAAGDARFPLSSEVCLRYRDFSLNESERTCLVQSAFAYNGRPYINTFCFKKSDIRTFRIDGIVSINGQNLADEDSRGRITSELFAIDESLNCTDFFVHPEAFQAYIPPLAILKRKAEDCFMPEDSKFDVLLSFCARSLSRGYWKEWYSVQKAASLALAGLTLDVTLVDWRAEMARLKRGRFSMNTLRQMVADGIMP